MNYIVIIVIVAILGNILITYFVKKVDNRRLPQKHPRMHVEQLKIQPAEVLRRWGKQDYQEIDVAGPINSKALEILKQYRSVGPDQLFLPIDRKHAEVPYKENQQFLQIGTWGDGSAVMVRRDVADPFIYLADCEDTGPESPVIIANSIEDFLKGAWAYHQDSLEWK